MAGLLNFKESYYSYIGSYKGITIHRQSANFSGLNYPVYYAYSIHTAWFPKSGPGYRNLWRLLKRIDDLDE